MIKIATNTLVTIFVIGLLAMSAPQVSAVSTVDQGGADERATRRLERIYKHHDRKMELRASVLDVSPEQLREDLKTSSFEQVIKRHGFKDRKAFHTAVIGKVKDELKQRGWSDKKIFGFLQKRIERLQK